MRLIVAEKPSVGRDIASALGARSRGNGWIRNEQLVVTWVFGHLTRLPQPHEIEDRWRSWRVDSLPMFPKSWPLVVREESRQQFDIIKKWLQTPEVEELVCACDAGREGELIFRHLIEAAGWHRPFSRLWISTLTEAAIRDGFRDLRPSSDFDTLADAARGRSRADWLVGLNLTRACTLAFRQQVGGDEPLSVGRVQTPTLALIVERDAAIRSFEPTRYQEVEATFSLPSNSESYVGTWFQEPRPTTATKRLRPDGTAEAIASRVHSGTAVIAELRSREQKIPPPQLYDLTELQRHANRLFGLSAKKTLNIAQSLYEQHKLISYPRTDSRYLSAEAATTLEPIVETIATRYPDQVAPESGRRPLGPRFVKDTKVTDHHAIIPTQVSALGLRLSRQEERIYDLICRRLLMAWHAAHRIAVTEVITNVTSGDDQAEDEAKVVDRFHSRGRQVVEVGWKQLETRPSSSKPDQQKDRLPAAIERGSTPEVEKVVVLDKQTKPPKPFTEATLLTAMETAGRGLDDDELSEAMKEKGLGTPATRAEILETLIRRKFIERRRKALHPTPHGIALINAVHPKLKSPEMTGEWEWKLKQIEHGKQSINSFLKDIQNYVSEVLRDMFGPAGSAAHERNRANFQQLPLLGQPPRSGSPSTNHRAGFARDRRSSTEAHQPVRLDARFRGKPLEQLLHDVFDHQTFRPSQEEVCRAIESGHDTLVVMPTGAGKSLCYQLPALTRGGTTLVISPLIALMEDQVEKLCQLGLRAERIHSGRDTTQFRQTCDQYRAGNLDFLFVAPERLATRFLPNLLEQRPPSLIAIDEAHCISHWGHDFRPEYRMLGKRIPRLRPAPVVALTATATPRVQEDIVQQLGLASAQRFIRGFRRTNLAIEVAELAPADRPAAVSRLLAVKEHRPAIVYCPTRKQAEQVADLLTDHCRAEAYHAGLPTGVRDRVQSRFLEGTSDVVVATVAFGMGIDKSNIRTVIHTGLPATVEGYYQEIGRAGRDGQPSRAILLYSFADRHTLQFFLDRDYPEPPVLQRLVAGLDRRGISKSRLVARSRLEPDALERALEKLWIHGGVEIDPDETVRSGQQNWIGKYTEQRAYRHQQLEHITRFAQSRECRMLHLVKHFGDLEDSGATCDLCDTCTPENTTALEYRSPSPAEQLVLTRILNALDHQTPTTGQLFSKTVVGKSLDRSQFEKLLDALGRSGYLELIPDSFVKSGRTIHFHRAQLTYEGRYLSAEDRAALQIVDTPNSSRRSTTKTKGRRPSKKPAGKRRARKPAPSLDEADVPQNVVKALKAMRLSEARRRRIPAFRVFPDRTILAIAAANPQNEDELLAISGIGPTLAKKYGQKILAAVAAES